MSANRSGLAHFFAVVAVLFLLRIALAYIAVPVGVAPALSLLNTVLFLGLAIYGLYRAASHEWKPGLAIGLLLVGALAHAGGEITVSSLPDSGLAIVAVSAIAQAGILVWCLGLGALLSLGIKDKNMMVPVAIFLAGFDIYLVFNPSAPMFSFLRENPELVRRLLMAVPSANVDGAATGTVQNLAYIGPADLLFSATFFALMFRYGMRAKRTVQWLIPVLLAYLLIVIYLGPETAIGPFSLSMLPALVPIGLVVLLVNRKEFKMERQEVLASIGVAVLAVSLASYGVYRAATQPAGPAPPTEPSQMQGGQEPPGYQG
ncbi:MAG: hypothetical protein IH944_09595 [Armatimonadetes bacterium]|nr:hypothetical protein [Armatimonadota bacterium]